MKFAYFLFHPFSEWSVSFFSIIRLFPFTLAGMEGVTATYPICPVFTNTGMVYWTIELFLPLMVLKMLLHLQNLLCIIVMCTLFINRIPLERLLLCNCFHHQSEHVTNTTRIINSSHKGRTEFQITFPLLQLLLWPYYSWPSPPAQTFATSTGKYGNKNAFWHIKSSKAEEKNYKL